MERKQPKQIVVKRKKPTIGGGILSALQRALWRREKSAKSSAAAPPHIPPSIEPPVAPVLTLESLFGDAVFALSTSDAPLVEQGSAATLEPPQSAPHPPMPVESEEEYEEDGEEGKESGMDQNAKHGKQRKFSRWVPKLLVPAEKMRNKIHTKKRKMKRHAQAEAPLAPELFTVINAQHMELLAMILAFLGGSEPARRCAMVNRTIAAGVRAYYELYCAQPRPTAFLVHRVLLTHPDSRYLSRILTYLPMKDRARASGTCSIFRKCCDAQPLELSSGSRAEAFVIMLGCEPTRVKYRYDETRTLRITNATSTSTSDIITFMETGDVECFASVRDLIMSNVKGFNCKSDRHHSFERIMQVLFTDHVSSRLETLVLNDLDCEDTHFQQLGRLLYDREFPRLRRLHLSRLSFPSRFMRDWARSFTMDRFKALSHLDITDVGMGNEDMQRFFSSLQHCPALETLVISHNAVSMETMKLFVAHLEEYSYLPNLSHFECEAVTADADASRALVVALMANRACRSLRIINISNNPLGKVQEIPEGYPRSDWGDLKHLNLSCMQLGTTAFTSVLCAFLPREKHTSSSLEDFDVSGNAVGAAIGDLARILTQGRFQQLRRLSLSDNAMDSLAFETLTAALCSSCCPFIEDLDLSGNKPGGEGISRFSCFLKSRAAMRLFYLSLSDNSLASRGQRQIAEALLCGACPLLHHLDLSRNLKPDSLVPFQQLIRSGACPSITSLQIAYAQTYADGVALVRGVRSCMSVEELRRLKQELFEARLRERQLADDQRAELQRARGKRQARALRELYDRLESEADRALRRRKLVRKSAHLLIHQEIARQVSELEHAARVRSLVQRR